MIRPKLTFWYLVVFQVKSKSRVRDELLGVVTVTGPTDNATKNFFTAKKLHGVGKEAKSTKAGKLYVKVAHFSQLEKA